MKDMKDIPHEVMWLQVCAHSGIPVGATKYYEIINKYPEYFPEEYDRHKRWQSIPKEVHDAKLKEYFEFRDKLWENEPKSPGLMGMVHNTEEYKKYKEAYDRLNPIENKKEEELSKKYYSKYGF